MLTAKQIKALPPGDYPNWKLMKLFPKQQGPGRSARSVRVKRDKGPGFIEMLINQFTGKPIAQLVKRKAK